MDIQKESCPVSLDTFIRPSLIEIADLGYQLSMQSWVNMNKPTENVKSVDFLAKRILALLIMRILGILSVRGLTPNLPSFPDLSTSSICYAILKECNCHKVNEAKEESSEIPREVDESYARKHVCDLDWPEVVTEEVVCQLHAYICKVLEGYRSVSYHNREHAYHVFISASKLLDMVLCEYDYTCTICTTPIRRPTRVTFGLKSDPLTQLAFLFSALVHDVDHTGVSNRQLVLECDELALMYNDQSVAEQRSLAIAFSLLMKKDFGTLRKVMFKEDKEYMKFRKIVIDLVLCTDIASPERVQIVKSKWKEAFGDKRPSQANRRTPTNVKRQDSIKSEDTYNRSNITHTASRRTNVSGSPDTGAIVKRDSVTFAEEPTSTSTADVRPRGNYISLSQRKKRNSWRTQPVDSSYSQPGKLSLLRRFLKERNSVGGNLAEVGGSSAEMSGSSVEMSERIVTKKKKLRSFRKALKKIILRQKRMQLKDPCIESKVDKIGLSENVNEENSPADRGTDSKQPCDPLRPVSLTNSSASVAIELAENKVTKGMVSIKRNMENMEQIKGILNEYEDDLSVSSENSDATSVYAPSKNEARDTRSRISRSFTDNKTSKDCALSRLRAEDHLSGNILSTDELMPSSKRGSNDSSKTSTNESLNKPSCRPRVCRRFTEPPNAYMDTKKFHFRLGIRRALDLTGNQIDDYKVNSTQNLELEYDPDQPDEFKVIVILEQLMKASDVAANMQGWDTMVAWCERLFQEQKNCHDDERGEDPITDWHENQIGFFESYTMPLACRLAETGVFGFGEVQMLVNEVRQNNTRWMIEGRTVLTKMVKDWRNMQHDKQKRRSSIL